MSKPNSNAKSNAAAPSGAERRRTRRRPILDTFSLFVVAPKKGVHRLQVHDLSDQGIAFDFDVEGEVHEEFPIAVGERIELFLYLNQSLYLPLSVNVKRLDDKGPVRKIGAEFVDANAPAFKGYLSFLALLDTLAESGQIDGG